MKYKLNTHYIVIKGSADGKIQEGDRLTINYHKNTNEFSTLGEYTMFLPPRENQSSFFGMTPLNTCLYFNKEELSAVMNELELKYDTKLVQKLIDDLQNKIDKLKTNHEI